MTIRHRERPDRVRLVAMLMLAAAFLIGPAAVAHAEPTPLSSTELFIDNAEIIDDQRVVDALNKLERGSKLPEVQVAVYTSNQTYPGNYDRAVLAEIAEEDTGEHIVKDGKLRSNILLLTISPRQNQMGIYLGSDLPTGPSIDEALSDMRQYLLGRSANTTSSSSDPDVDNAIFVSTLTYLDANDIALDPAKQNAEDSGKETEGWNFWILVIPMSMLAIGCIMAIDRP